MMVVISIMEFRYSSIVKNLTMTKEIAMSYKGQQKQGNIQTEELKYNKSEMCPDCHGSGSLADTTCSSCNGKGVI